MILRNINNKYSEEKNEIIYIQVIVRELDKFYVLNNSSITLEDLAKHTLYDCNLIKDKNINFDLEKDVNIRINH